MKRLLRVLQSCNGIPHHPRRSARVERAHTSSKTRVHKFFLSSKIVPFSVFVTFPNISRQTVHIFCAFFVPEHISPCAVLVLLYIQWSHTLKASPFHLLPMRNPSVAWEMAADTQHCCPHRAQLNKHCTESGHTVTIGDENRSDRNLCGQE